jgi:hypothetical protein
MNTILLAVAAAAAPAHAAPPRAVFMLPMEEGIRMEWVIAAEGQDDPEAAGFRFAADEAGRPWFFDGARKRLVSPTEQRTVATREAFRDLVFASGDPIVCTDKALGALALPEAPAGKDAAAVAPMAVLAPLTQKECRLFEGGARALYVVERNAASGEDEVFLLRTGQGKPKTTKLLAAEFRVGAVAGDGETTFVAAKGLIFRLKPSGPERYYDAKKTITGLAYADGVGLFYATTDGVGFVHPDYQTEFVRSPGAEIVLRGRELLVRFGKSFAVAKIAGADLFKNARWASSKKP